MHCIFNKIHTAHAFCSFFFSPSNLCIHNNQHHHTTQKPCYKWMKTVAQNAMLYSQHEKRNHRANTFTIWITAERRVQLNSKNLLAWSVLHVGMLCTCFESSLQATDNKQASYIHLKYFAPAAWKFIVACFSHKGHYISAHKFTYRQNTTCGADSGVYSAETKACTVKMQ